MRQWILSSLILFALTAARKGAKGATFAINAQAQSATLSPSSDPTADPSAIPTQQPTRELVEPTISTWTDDNVISFDGDLGWKIYDAADELTDMCSNVDDCRREESGQSYYGPFNAINTYDADVMDGMYLARRFSCAYRSKVNITFNIASCNVAGTNNVDRVDAWIFGTKLGKNNIPTSEAAKGDNLFAEDDGCSEFYVQSYVPNDKEVIVEPDTRFWVKIRTKVGEGQAYLYGFELTCDPSELDQPVDSPDSDDGSSTQTHSEYCISGLADDSYNGEYALMEDFEENAILDANGQKAFEKYSYDGVAYLYELGDAWVVGSELNGNETVMMCQIDSEVNDGYLPQVHLHCANSGVDPAGSTVEEGECAHHDVVIGSLQALGDLSLSPEVKTELLSLVFGAVAVAFMMGMVACLCCTVCCKKTPYKHLEDSEDSDVEAL